MASSLTIAGLDAGYGAVRVLEDISLEVRAGGVLPFAEPGWALYPRALGLTYREVTWPLDGLTKVRWERVATPWGMPSDDLMHGELNGQRLKIKVA